MSAILWGRRSCGDTPDISVNGDRSALSLALTDVLGRQVQVGVPPHAEGRWAEEVCARGGRLARWCMLVQPGGGVPAYGRPAAGGGGMRRAAAVKPDYGPAWDTLASVLREMGRYDEAMTCIDRAVAAAGFADHPLEPGDRAAAGGAAGRRVGRGGIAVRLHAGVAARLPPAGVGRPERSGRPDHPAPCGTGSRRRDPVLPLRADGGGEGRQRVLLECQPELAPLLATAPGVSQVIRRGEPLPPFDLHCPLLSLPHRFGTTLETIPATVPYLTPEEQKVQAWRSRLAGDGPGLKVGLAWAGSPGHANDRQRSCRLSDFAPLAHVPNVTFYSLQKGPAAAQVASPPPGMRLQDLTADLHDFADTAALVASLDLIISVDTSVVHLAGAGEAGVGAPSPYARLAWLRDREDSPWYPTARLFRQAERGDWESVMKRVAGDMANEPPGS